MTALLLRKLRHGLHVNLAISHAILQFAEPAGQHLSSEGQADPGGVLTHEVKHLQGKGRHDLSPGNHDHVADFHDLRGYVLQIFRPRKNGAGIGYFAQNVIDTLKDKEKYEVITFDDTLPELDICAVYLGDFVIPVLKRFIDFLENNRG